MDLYRETQYYKNIALKLIDRNYTNYKAKRYTINNTNQNVWIPNKHLTLDGKIKNNENLDYIFKKAIRKLEIANVEEKIIKNLKGGFYERN